VDLALRSDEDLRLPFDLDSITELVTTGADPLPRRFAQPRGGESLTTIDDVRRYYDEVYFRDLRSSRPAAHYDLYLRLLKAQPGCSLLDVGCGLGPLLQIAQRRGLKCAGIDLSERAIAEARRLIPGGDLRVGQATELPWPDRSFDYVSCLGALEHFLDEGAALREMRRVATREARFLIMVPNVDYEHAGTEQGAVVEERLRSLTEWREVLSRNGFTILEVSPDRWPVHWIPLPKRKPFVFARGLYRRWKAWSLPLERSYQFIFVCR
jgi:SAM-dependent methyltransferase